MLITGGQKDSLINTYCKGGPITANTGKNKNYKKKINLNQLPLFTSKGLSGWVTFLEIMLLIPWGKIIPSSHEPSSHTLNYHNYYSFSRIFIKIINKIIDLL